MTPPKMTPEQRASAPDHPVPGSVIASESLARVKACLHSVREMRVHRQALEYPRGHGDIHRRHPIVAEWEKEHGPV